MEELTFQEIYRTISKNLRFILLITLAIVIATLLISLIIPKTYISESIIQIGSIQDSSGQNNPIIQEIEAKNLLSSSIILDPVISKYFNNKTSIKEFSEKDLNIELIKETIDTKTTETVPYIKITTYSNNPEKAKEINQEIIKNFLDYNQKEYEDLIAIKQEELLNTQKQIADIKTNIASLESTIASKNLKDIDVITIQNALSQYFQILSDNQKKESQLKNVLVTAKEFKIINKPQSINEYIWPKLWLNLLVSLIIGFIFAVFIAFSKENRER